MGSLTEERFRKLEEADRLESLMVDWANGRRSWNNLLQSDHPELIQIADALEVLAKAAAITVLRTPEHKE
jgi:hypothetical protein